MGQKFKHSEKPESFRTDYARGILIKIEENKDVLKFNMSIIYLYAKKEGTRMKRIYFDAGKSFHSLFREVIQYPPGGYEFIIDKTMERKEKLNTARNLFSMYHPVPMLRYATYFSWWLTRSLKKIPSNIDLTYSAHRLVLRKEPWVVAMEEISELCPVMYDIGHLRFYRSIIEKVLSSKYCKKIMPWLDYGKKTILLNLDCKKFENKIETVHLAVHPKHFTKQHKKDKVTLLFVGTIHKSNIPTNFVVKGGKEVLEAFEILNKKYDNLELIIRACIPSSIKSRYSKILESERINLDEKLRPRKQFEEVYTRSDILLLPSHYGPGMTILDAMSYELPAIVLDVRGYREVVEDGKTGFLVRKSKRIRYDLYGNRFMKAIECVDPRVVRDLVEKTSILIESETLRRKMGRAARKEIETGKFSIGRRNEKLKEIFDEAIKTDG